MNHKPRPPGPSTGIDGNKAKRGNMCGRYIYNKATKEIQRYLDLGGSYTYNDTVITPAMDAVSLVKDKKLSESIAITSLFWGIVGYDKKLIINAKSESVADKTLFADSFMARRCILPAAGFYEWDKAKTKYEFKREDTGSIYLAGLYDLSDNKDSFVILTTSANESMKPVHDRMPVIIDKKDVKEYLLDTSSALDIIKQPMPQLVKSSEYEQLSLFD